MEPVNVIQVEINRLAVLIAIAKWDYAEAVAKRLPEAHRTTIADELCSYELQKKCLETKNFKALPYAVKMLYNGQKLAKE